MLDENVGLFSQCLTLKENRAGAVARALHLVVIPSIDAICELSLLLALFRALKGFPLGTPLQFLISPNTNNTKF